ncbi:MAG: amino acid carrier protein [Pseudomonadota bacterium]
MQELNDFMAAINAVLWHEIVLFALLGTGVLFTVWSRFSQFRALSHGTQLLRGRYDASDAPGAVSHFQAMTAALSGTVGLGNIGGVALAISLGGPGAVFWMWLVGLVGMATKLTEVTLAMLYRNVDDPQNPHGGPMWVARKGFAAKRADLAGFGKAVGVLLCVTLLIATTTGGNMFQAWSVGDLTESYFGVPSVITGIILALIVGSVIIGGISRIGAVTSKLVPAMVVLYLLAGSFVLISNLGAIPQMLILIVTSAFSPAEAEGAFIGGSVASAFLFGMKRAQFSNEAGQGTSPIVHAAARTHEPVREGVVAGLEPFVDTVVVCTFTALIILSTGVWNRPPAAAFETTPTVLPVSASMWTVETMVAPPRDDGRPWSTTDDVFLIYQADLNPASGNALHRLYGHVEFDGPGSATLVWDEFTSGVVPQVEHAGIYVDYTGATLTAQAFDSVAPGLGQWLVTFAAWLFAISTMVSWSYYGEQGIVYLAGQRAVLPYKLAYCGLIIVATLGFIRTSTELDNLTGIGMGVMLVANLPIMWLFGHQAINAYRDYIRRLDSGEFEEPQ